MIPSAQVQRTMNGEESELVGWRVAGLEGLLAATLAAVIPSSIIALLVGRLYVRVARQDWNCWRKRWSMKTQIWCWSASCR